MRARRSSLVIGFARSRIEVSAAIAGGSGPDAGALRPRCAETRVTGSPAAASQRKERRESMSALVNVNRVITRLPDYPIYQPGGDGGAVDARRLVRFGLGEQRVDRVGPAPGQQIFLRNVAAPQHAGHLRDKEVVLDE